MIEHFILPVVCGASGGLLVSLVLYLGGYWK